MKRTARSYTGAQKDVVRRTTVTPGKIYTNVFDLPGEHCRSIRSLIDGGNCSPDTTITVAERYSATMSAIQKEFRKFPFKKVNFPPPGLIENVPDFGPYDRVNLDTCSSLSMPMLDWIGRQQFLPDGEINVWLTAYRNKQEFRDSLLSSFLETRPGIAAVSELRDRSTDGLRGVGPVQLVTAAAIYSALNNYDCTVEPVQSYCEHVNFMYVYRFTGLQRRRTPRPALNTLLVRAEVPGPSSAHGGHGPAKLADDTAMEMCLKAIQGGPGARAYCTRQLRLVIVDGQLTGKDPKWIKAGWKSYLSRRAPELKTVAHDYIDSL